MLGGVMMKDRGMVYIAGPYTYPDPVINTRSAIDAWEVLVNAGYTPVVPHLTLFAHFVYPHDPNFWYEYDLRLLDRCDVLLRLPGESWGADQEVKYANELGLPVFIGTVKEFLLA